MFIYKLYFYLKAKFLKDEPFINGYDSLEEFQTIRDYITKLIDPQKEDTLLEFGCGTGLYIRTFSPLCKDIIAVDHIQEMVRQAKSQCNHFLNVKIFHHTVMRLPFEDNSFDKILSWSNFQYIKHQHQIELLLKEFYRVTKPGGIILIGDLPSGEGRSLSHINKSWSLFEKIIHLGNYFLYQFYDQKTFQALCENILGETNILANQDQKPGRFNVLVKVKKES